MDQDYTFQVLAPSWGTTFGRRETNSDRYEEKLEQAQRLRGQVYLSSGAISPHELEPDGRFAMRGDRECWHFLLVDGDGAVVGCSRYRLHPNITGSEPLQTLEGGLGSDSGYEAVRRALETDLEFARSAKLSYVEIGGWALSKGWQGTRAALETLLSGYALGALWGGAILLGLATVQQGASSVLRRIGGSSLNWNGETLPPIAHNRYRLPLEVLRFDSRMPMPRFSPLIDRMIRSLASSVVLLGEPMQKRDFMSRLAFGAWSS